MEFDGAGFFLFILYKQDLEKIVKKCLDQAVAQGHSSIAFPALGTGNLKYPEQEVAKGMIEAVIDYAKTNPGNCITDVKIVIYLKDIKTQMVFTCLLFRSLLFSPTVSVDLLY